MSRSQKVTAAVMTVLAGAAIYCFFSLKYPYHIHFQEQYQLFESTWDYFAGVAWAPGGLSDWTGRFITQFFYYAPAGAALLAVVLCGLQLLVWAVCRRRNLTVYALSFIPAALLMAFFCDENALVSGAMALVLSLFAAALVLLVRNDRLRRVVEVVLVPVAYLACGPLAVAFVLVVAIREIALSGGRGLIVAAVMALLLVVCPVLSARIFPYPLGRLFLGVHYYRYHNLLPGLLWISALSSALCVLVSCFGRESGKATRRLIPGILAFAAVAALGVTLTLRMADGAKEEWMKYDFMVRMQMWNRLMKTADKRNPDNPKTVSCLNLALAKSGRMAGSQFEYFQNGPDGLLPQFQGDFTNPVSTGEIYWHLGMVNTAQRFAFEAQEAIPDFQKSARFYKRLAETNIVNGDLEVARKYLRALQNALFYRDWADETLLLLDAGHIFEARPELALAHEMRLKEHDFLFSDTEMDSMLGLLNVEHPENTMAVDYLMSWCLLRKDLDRFVECLPLVTSPAMPKGYQEALLLRWVQTHSDFEGLPVYISKNYARRINAFITDMQSGKAESEMQHLYGDTYWFYYYYRYRSGQ